MMLPAAIMPALAIGIIPNIINCTPPSDTKVNVNFTQLEMRVDNTQNHDQLKVLNADSMSPHHSGDFPIVNGLTNSKIEVATETSFKGATYPLLKKTCMWVDEINVNISYTPIIYIYNGYNYGSCKYDEVMKHELRHVNTDISTLNEYANYFQETAINTSKSIASTAPIDSSTTDAYQKKLSQAIATSMQNATEQMKKSITVKQRQIDSRAEYDRLSRTCPNERNL